MRTAGRFFAAILIGFTAIQAAAQIQVTVNGNQGPWDPSLNPNYTYGMNDNTAPTVISAAPGFSFIPGGTVTVSYVSGTVTACVTSAPYQDANGELSDPVDNTCICPSYYMSPYPIYLVELVGTFANNGVIVGQPFTLGDSPATFVIPAGANQLLLGVNDGYYSDNGGSWILSVSSAAPTNTGALPLQATPLINDPSLVSYWPFEGNSTDWKGSYNGSDTSITYSTSYGRFGEGAYFDGSTSKIDLPTPTFSGSTFTLSAWCYPQGITGNPYDGKIIDIKGSDNSRIVMQQYANPTSTVVGISNAFASFVSTNWATGPNAYANSSAVAPNQWYLVTTTYDGANLNLYLNGVLATSTPQISTLNLNAYFEIGNEAGDPAYAPRYFHGDLDDLAVFSRALSSGEISNLYTGNWPTATTTVTLSSNLNPSTYGRSFTLSAKVIPTVGSVKPTGNVTFSDSGTIVGTVALSGGKATLPISTLPTGLNPITAAYGGDVNYAPSVSPVLNQQVNQATTTTVLKSSPKTSQVNQAVTLTATVTGRYGGTPTGNVTFSDSGNTLGVVALSGGKATLPISTLPTGLNPIIASYGGDVNYLSGVSPVLNQQVNQVTTTTTLSSSTNPSNANQPVTLTATVMGNYGGTPTGSVTFQQGGNVLGTAQLVNAQGTLAYTFLASGSLNIKVAYSGDTNFKGSTSAQLTQIVIANTFNPPAGTYSSPQQVTISSAMSGSTIYYTTNGTSPTSSSVLYTIPVVVGRSETIQAITIASGKKSSVTSAAYTIETPDSSVQRLLAYAKPGSNIPYDKMTHIIHWFLTLTSDGSIAGSSNLMNAAKIAQEKAAGVKVMLSVGGPGQAKAFSAMAADTNARAAFVNNITNFLITYGYDGVDIDWEYPTVGKTHDDTTYCTELMQSLYTALHPSYLLSMAVPPRPDWYPALDYVNLRSYVDFFNVMTYDFDLGSDYADYNSPLHENPSDENPRGSIENSVSQFLDIGVPADKINIGIPFYGYLYNGVTRWGPCGGVCSPTPKGGLAYTQITPLMAAGWTKYFDDTAGVPYLIPSSGSGFVTYDDTQSIPLKAQYVLGSTQSGGNQLGGIFLWDLSQDDDQGQHVLLDSMFSAYLINRNY